MKIKQLAKNQIIVEDGNKKTFQSYDSIIAIVENGKVKLDSSYWNYSKTTSKYRNIFLGESSKETQEKIISGEYEFANLN
jgi:hypothetical protein